MERQELPIRFADLRRLAGAVPAYIGELGYEDDTPLTARLEEDLGISGDDLVELLEKFAGTYRVELAAFDFTGLISPEGMDFQDGLLFLLVIPLGLYLLTVWLLRAVAAGLCWPFAPGLAGRIWQWQTPCPTFETANRPHPLTVGDFVASAAVGRFVRREQVYFQLVR